MALRRTARRPPCSWTDSRSRPGDPAIGDLDLPGRSRRRFPGPWHGGRIRHPRPARRGRTYDAEYVALAKILGCRLVTLDARLRRGADRLGFVVTPAEL